MQGGHMEAREPADVQDLPTQQLRMRIRMHTGAWRADGYEKQNNREA